LCLWSAKDFLLIDFYRLVLAIDRVIKLTLTDKKLGIQIDLVLTTEALIN
jgi:hypothetical protein